MVLLLYCCPSVQAADYYVSPSGNDADSGSQALPWKTITKAANTMSSGDTVYIGAGTYPEVVTPVHSGSAGKYITYRAMPGEQVIIEGAGITLPNYETGLINIEDVSYIRISGLEVRNAGPNMNNAGIYVDRADNIILEKNKTYNTVSSGIGVWGSTNITIKGNELELACNDGEQECLTVAGTNGFVISNNEVHHNGLGTNGGEGIAIKDGSTNGHVVNNYIHDLTQLGIYIDAWDKRTSAIVVSKNRVHSTRNDGITLSSERGGLLENIRVENNIISNVDNNGISVTPNGTVNNPPMRYLKIINNTVYKNGQVWGGGIGVDNPNISNLVIRNNIFSKNSTFQIVIDVAVAGLEVDHNLVYGFRNYPNEITGASFVSGNPLFVNAAAGDFHLGASSPARNKGSSVNAPVVDFDSNKRPYEGAIDIGAYEYVVFSPLHPPLPGTYLLLSR